jgi:hypothetical protein
MSERINDGNQRLMQMLTAALGASHLAIDDLAALVLSAKANERDAERYRFLRQDEHRDELIGSLVTDSPEELDREIDAAMERNRDRPT